MPPASRTLAVLLTLAAGPALAAEPATVAQAAAVLDLETFPLPPGAERTAHQRLANAGYSTADSASAALEYVEKLLTEQGWERLPGGYSQGQFASGDYKKDGFVVHVSATPHGDGRSTSVQVTHQGNVGPSEVPVPEGSDKLYAFPAVAMYKTPLSVDEAFAACRERMLAEGWTPYGGATGSEYFRKNAVQADFSIQSAPGQGGATVISLTTHLLSLELPAPPFADGFHYTDGTSDLGFDCDETPERVADYYREALSPLGWAATTDKPVKIDWKLFTIFRNDGQEMITLSTHDFEGRTRAFINHQNAEEVAEDEAAAAEEAGRVATYRFDDRPTVEVKLPTGLEGVPVQEWAVKVRATGRDSFAVADEIAKSLEGAGWSATGKPATGPAVRTHRLLKDDREIRLVAAKAPKRDPWVFISGVGVNLQAR